MIPRLPTFYAEYGRATQRRGISPEEYRLRVTGAVRTPLILTLSDLADRKSVRIALRFHCVSAWSCGMWVRGVAVRDVLDSAEPLPGASFLRATSFGGYEDTSRIDELVNGGALLVTHMNDEPLTLERGAPVRLMPLDKYQFKGVKQVVSLEVVDTYRDGTWSRFGYERSGRITDLAHYAIDLGRRLSPEEARERLTTGGEP